MINKQPFSGSFLLFAVMTTVICMLLVFVLPFNSEAETFVVNNTADTVDAAPGDAACVDSLGKCTLRAAIQEANALPGFDTITLPAGVYILTIPGTEEDSAATGDLDIIQDLTINGEGAGVTVVDANGIDRVFHGPLTGITININDITITGGNSAHGGGIHTNINNTVSISRCTITNNTVSVNGAGVEANGTYVIRDSTISNNITQGDSGGGIWLDTGTMELINSTVSGNSAVNLGGGIYAAQDSLLDVINSTIKDNSANTNGSGIYIESGTVTLKNTIFDNNSGSSTCFSDSGSISSLGHNIEDTNNDCNLGGTDDLVNTDPLLGPLFYNGGPTMTHALLPESPGIDTGDNTACFNPPMDGNDQRSVARPTDGDFDTVPVCDRGAFEFLPVINNNVALLPEPSSYSTTVDSAGCPVGEAFVGKFEFDAILTNIDVYDLQSLISKNVILTNNNLVQNTDGEQGGVDYVVTVQQVPGSDYQDGILNPSENVTVHYTICLKTLTPFNFFVDILANVLSGEGG